MKLEKWKPDEIAVLLWALSVGCAGEQIWVEPERQPMTEAETFAELERLGFLDEMRNVQLYKTEENENYEYERETE